MNRTPAFQFPPREAFARCFAVWVVCLALVINGAQGQESAGAAPVTNASPGELQSVQSTLYRLERAALARDVNALAFFGATVPADPAPLAIQDRITHLALSNPQNYQAPSRRKVLESAFGAFANAGESAKQKGILEWLISIEDKPQPANSKSLALGTNTLDWARGTLASLLMQPKNAPRADLERALALLQAIESTDMGGFRHLQVTLQQRLERLPSASLASPTSHSLPLHP